jgi:hypothetical protein
VLSVFAQAWGSFTEVSARAIDATGGSVAAAAVAYQRVDASVIAEPGVTAAFVADVAAGGDGRVALGADSGLPLREPR